MSRIAPRLQAGVPHPTMIYDLDKTQEWLNRTLAVGKTPPLRGGRSSEPHARRHTSLSVAAAVTTILLGMLLISWTRMGGRDTVGANVVAVEGNTRVAEVIPTAPSPVSVEAQRLLLSSPSPPRQTWTRTSLDGDVRPLPGHTAPPAPVWLDGGVRFGR